MPWEAWIGKFTKVCIRAIRVIIRVTSTLTLTHSVFLIYSNFNPLFLNHKFPALLFILLYRYIGLSEALTDGGVELVRNSTLTGVTLNNDGTYDLSTTSTDNGNNSGENSAESPANLQGFDKVIMAVGRKPCVGQFSSLSLSLSIYIYIYIWDTRYKI